MHSLWLSALCGFWFRLLLCERMLLLASCGAEQVRGLEAGKQAREEQKRKQPAFGANHQQGKQSKQASKKRKKERETKRKKAKKPTKKPKRESKNTLKHTTKRKTAHNATKTEQQKQSNKSRRPAADPTRRKLAMVAARFRFPRSPKTARNHTLSCPGARSNSQLFLLKLLVKTHSRFCTRKSGFRHDKEWGGYSTVSNTTKS